MHFSLQRALLHCSSQTSVEPLKDYSARKSISLQSGSLSAGLFRPVSRYKTNLTIMEATAVNKQRQYNIFLFQCHWFSASMRLLQRLLFITAVRQKHNGYILSAHARPYERLCVSLFQWITCSCHRAQMMSHMSAMWAITFQRTTPVSPITSPDKVGPSGGPLHTFIYT